MSKRFNRFFFALAACAFILTGCGGGGSSLSDTGTPQTVATPQSAKFLDSAVSGITVKSGAEGSHVSVTAEDGTFTFVPGTPVEFSIGKMVLGTLVNTKILEDSGVATPLTLDSDGTSDASVKATNILRILQTLDDDNDPSNGILIKNGVAAALGPVDFSVPEDQFESHEKVSQALAKVAEAENAPPRSVVAPDAARAHFRQSMGTLFQGQYNLSFDGAESKALLTLTREHGADISGATPENLSFYGTHRDGNGNLVSSCIVGPGQVSPKAPVACYLLAVTRYTGTSIQGTYIHGPSGRTGVWSAELVKNVAFVAPGRPYANVTQDPVTLLYTQSYSWTFVNLSSSAKTPTALNVATNTAAPYDVSGTCAVNQAVASGETCTVVVSFPLAPVCDSRTFTPSLTTQEGIATGNPAYITFSFCND